MRNIEPNTKICEWCARQFERRPTCAAVTWHAQRFCSLSCSTYGRQRPSIEQRLEHWSMPEPNSGCWLWLGALNKYGYGRLGNIWLAHRLSFERFVGPIPDGLFVLHTCDTPSCINPDHLYAGTALDNSDDVTRRGRRLTGTRHPRAKLTPEIAERIRKTSGPAKVIAERYGISKTTVISVRNGSRWIASDTYDALREKFGG